MKGSQEADTQVELLVVFGSVLFPRGRSPARVPRGGPAGLSASQRPKPPNCHCGRGRATRRGPRAPDTRRRRGTTPERPAARVGTTAQGRGGRGRGGRTCRPQTGSEGAPEPAHPPNPHSLPDIFRVLHGERTRRHPPLSAASEEPPPIRIFGAAAVVAMSVSPAPGHWPRLQSAALGWPTAGAVARDEVPPYRDERLPGARSFALAAVRLANRRGRCREN